MILAELILAASGLMATTYGYGEQKCGDPGKPESCNNGAVTASGIPFDPAAPMAAIAVPANMRLRAQFIGLQIPGGACHKILLADKMHHRFMGRVGFDLTPAAVALLTGAPATPYWSGPVYVCQLPVIRAKIRKAANTGR